MRFEGFGAGACRFYEELAEDNSRDWFAANRARYEAEIRAPIEYLLDDLSGEFGEGRVFRPNRDVRFSKDKSPYKTNAAAVIERDGGTLYVQISADGLMVGGGAYALSGEPLGRLRAAIDDDRTGSELEAIVSDLHAAGAETGAHETLKTAPRGYSNDHPRIDLLRHKGIIGWWEHPPRRWLTTAAARDRVADGWRALGPLNAWLDANVRVG